MITCRKTYADVPFAHRQHLHDGHCQLIHGHNWGITFTFGCHSPDANGFVVDFGGLKFLRAWLAQHLDHACVFNHDDPLRETLVAAAPRRVESLPRTQLLLRRPCQPPARRAQPARARGHRRPRLHHRHRGHRGRQKLRHLPRA